MLSICSALWLHCLLYQYIQYTALKMFHNFLLAYIWQHDFIIKWQCMSCVFSHPTFYHTWSYWAFWFCPALLPRNLMHCVKVSSGRKLCWLELTCELQGHELGSWKLRSVMFSFNCLSKPLQGVLSFPLCPSPGGETQFKLRLVNPTLLSVECVTPDLNLKKVPKSRANLLN